MVAYCLIPIVLQAVTMVIDEGWFHRERGLSRAERIGHPLCTLTIALCLLWLVTTDPGSSTALPVYISLAAFSTLFVTKDEAMHVKQYSRGEHWLHALLFMLHPIVLAAFAYLWWIGMVGLLVGQLGITIAFLAYQVIYWSIEGDAACADPEASQAAWYADLGSRWYVAGDTPIALLRAESRRRNPWVAARIAQAFGPASCRVLDLGCGGGFLSNYLAARGHRVTGIDPTLENLAVARANDPSQTVIYELGDPHALPYARHSFEVVCAMDLLEHLEDPERVIAEASRVLVPGGLFVFHTFNRTWLANLIVIKGIAWFVRNARKDLHVLRRFVRPDELQQMCRAHHLEPVVIRGSRPRLRWPLWRLLVTGKVGDDFTFTTMPSQKLGYTGIARRGDAPVIVDEVRVPRPRSASRADLSAPRPAPVLTSPGTREGL
jgi:2-polyprenyl-6-hydroxyphenyl methylase / 3-demethylubiquinone-9 3-methyltransferase